MVCCEEAIPETVGNYKGMFIHVPMMDEDWFQPKERDVMVAAAAVVEMWRRHGRTLIHCSAGLNRSSVVTAMTLVELGLSRAEAIRLIREKRDPFCLCNRTFERWVLREPMPTAETSIFNQPSETDGAAEGTEDGRVDSAG